AVGGVAAPVRPGQAEFVADEVDEQQARFDDPGVVGPVDINRDLHQGTCLRGVPVGRPPGSALRARLTARRRARMVSSLARCFLYSAGPRWSEIGWQCSAAIWPARVKLSSLAGAP